MRNKIAFALSAFLVAGSIVYAQSRSSGQGGGSGLTTDMANLSATPAIPSDLIFATSVNGVITSKSVASGNSFYMTVGTGNVTAGSGGSGITTVTSGTTSSGNAGAVSLYPGAVAGGAGVGGSLYLSGGTADTAAAGGNVYIYPGLNTAATPGILYIQHAAEGTSGHCLVSYGTTGQAHWAVCPAAGATSVSATDGTVGAPSITFSADPDTGLYRIGTNDIGISAGGTLGVDVVNIGSSLVNIGLGVAAAATSNAPITANRTSNETVYYTWGNASNGSASGTVFQVANGPGSNYTTIENNAYDASPAYLTGGSAVFASPNQTQMNFGCEYASCYTAFNVGGRTLATERARLTTTDLTLNKGVNLILGGSTSGLTTLAVPATVTSHTLTLPAAQGAANAVLLNDGSGNLNWVQPAVNSIINCSIGVTIGSSAVTFSLLDGGGAALSSTSPCVIAFRNVTAATGTYTNVVTTAASAGVNTVVGANTDSLGCPTAAAACVLTIYAINNGGTVELGVFHGGALDEGSVHSSTALTGSADTADFTLWSTTARSSKAVRVLARVQITPAAAFAWTNAVTEISPFTAQTKLTPWHIQAYFTGGSPNLGTADITTNAEITNASLTLNPVAGSAPVGTMCSSTNAATAPSSGNTTCAAGSESIGVNFSLPSPGLYKACFYSTWFARTDSGVRVQAFFEMVETATNAQTKLGVQQPVGGTQAMGITIATGVSNEDGFIVSQCGIFDWSGVAAGTTKGIREFYGQTTTGTPTQVALYCDNTQNRNCYWTVERMAN